MPLRKFKEKFRVNSINRDEKCVDLKRFCRKWNKIAASVVATLTFILLLSYVIYDSFDCDTVIILPHNDEDVKDLHNDAPSVKSFAGICFLELNNLDIESEDYFNGTNCGTAALTIKNFEFLNGTISSGWFEDVMLDVVTIAFVNTSLETIDETAFTSSTFDNLVNMTIEDSKITDLRKRSFQNLELRYFTLGFTDFCNTMTIEEDILNGTSASLIELKLHHFLSSNEDLCKLVGTKSSPFPNLEVLDLNDNLLQTLDEDSFQNTPALRYLYIKDNQLSSLDVNAFRSLTCLQVLDLSGNKLATLPQGIFDYFPTVQLHLYDNCWNCTCALMWIHDFVLNTNQPTICANSNDNLLQDFNCERIPQSTDATRIETPNPFLDVTITYTDMKRSEEVVTIPSHSWSSTFHITPISNQYTELTYSGLYMETGVYELDISGDVRNFQLVWFNNDNFSDFNSVNDIKGKILMEGMKLKTVYTFCLLLPSRGTFLDCIQKEPNFRDFPQGSKKSIKLIAGISVASILCTAVITGLVVFYYIRQHPRLISGNKRVVIVGSKTTDAIVLPKTYLRHKQEAKNACAGYLTPRTPEKLVSRRTFQMRSSSESSAMSGVSYIATDFSPKLSLDEKTIKDHIYESVNTAEYCKYESKQVDT